MSARRANVSRSFFNRMIRNNYALIANELLGEAAVDVPVEIIGNNDDVPEDVDVPEVVVDVPEVLDAPHVVDVPEDNDVPEELIFGDEEDLEGDEEDLEDVDEIDGVDLEFDINEGADSFMEKLARLVIKYRLTRAATNELLRLLKETGHDELPITRESLLHTPSTPIIPRHVFPGEYFHVGLRKCLKRCNFSFLQNIDIVELDINIDGLSVSKSSKLKMWPILGSFPNQLNISPFVIGAYVGYADPRCIEDFLKEYIEEFQDIMQNGAEVTSHLIRKVIRIRAYICDAPARAFLCGVHGHQANLGCNKCEQLCIRVGTKKTFSTIAGELRTDESFGERRQVEHHKPQFINRLSPLENLGTRMVTQVVNDPMHLIDEGVFAKIIESIFFGPCRNMYLQNLPKRRMDNIYIAFSSYVPCEFERKTRSILHDFSGFKGNEFRFWGLYGGFVQIKDFVSEDLYQHFLKLFVAIRLLACNASHIINADYAQMLLEEFVAQYPAIYDYLVRLINEYIFLKNHFINQIIFLNPIGV